MANKHCRKFNNHEDYISALINGEFIKHNISYCKEEKDAHYDKWLDNRYMIECRYYITDTTKRYNIYQHDYGSYKNFKEIVIDGNKIENYDFQDKQKTSDRFLIYHLFFIIEHSSEFLL